MSVQHAAIQIRELNPLAESEINLVAERMRDTLIEVEGAEIGKALYTIEWLRDRVRWHLNPLTASAKIYLAISDDGQLDEQINTQIIGHTIVRKEIDSDGIVGGLFSTTYVLPTARKTGIADQLLLAGERWMRAQSLPSAATWTSQTNAKLIKLYAKHGYIEAGQHVHELTGTVMIKLEKLLK